MATVDANFTTQPSTYLGLLQCSPSRFSLTGAGSDPRGIMPAKPLTPRRQPKQSKLSFKPAAQNGNVTTPSGKNRTASANGNILNFFKKVEVEEQLFLPGVSAVVPAIPTPPDLSTSEDRHGAEDCAQETALDDDQHPSKRRKLSGHTSDLSLRATTPKGDKAYDQVGLATHFAEQKKPARRRPAKKRGKGPFLVDSDSEDDRAASTTPSEHATGDATTQSPISTTDALGVPIPPKPNLPVDESCPALDDPDLQRDENDDQFNGFEDIEDLFGDGGDDEFNEGEEFRERLFMEEQARLEAEELGGRAAQTCPICNTSLDGITPDKATLHVNACLDGSPLPISAPMSPLSANTIDTPGMSKRFAKAAVPRPGQEIPIGLGNNTNNSTSAFGKLMSGHAEQSAWASAAAAEHASRGKPAYQRTCPFYKIMPGLFICVDAFRYGAVKGCNAYFLSHFHSDHYIGLTANWSHGPIYCSKVTGSLIKSQLRTAAKYVKELDFEDTVEVPGTEGVMVTMIPANHCPGSSLFLFEKRIGKGSSHRTQRILHCGDFRACPAQVAHPLLKPDILDTVSGKLKQQKIDICYLDTTYLNPRYSFPPQHDVIRACAEFCKSLSEDPSIANGAFDRLKLEKGSKTVNSFFSKEKASIAATLPENGISDNKAKSDSKRLLVVCGTYSIGKERICKAVAQALNTKIFASASKIKICSQLGDPELAALMTSNPYEAQVHMQMLMEIRAETLQDYLDSYKPHFTHIVGFRPSGWNFSAASTTGSKSVSANTPPGAVSTMSILHGEAWRTRFETRDLVAQRGSTREAMCFGVPYSEHSSFRELALFLMALRIEKVIPTVNVGSEGSRKRMKMWTDRWLSERRKGGLVRVLEGDADTDCDTRKVLGEAREDGNGEMIGKPVLWNGKDGKGGGAYW
ncbi:DRMBL-domain-containing protein [Xylaria intraflava]|nr:DRMBL-domain-containing protein [Xylaria intraflava]